MPHSVLISTFLRRANLVLSALPCPRMPMFAHDAVVGADDVGRWPARRYDGVKTTADRDTRSGCPSRVAIAPRCRSDRQYLPR
jgi:hypothetical protein